MPQPMDVPRCNTTIQLRRDWCISRDWCIHCFHLDNVVTLSFAHFAPSPGKKRTQQASFKPTKGRDVVGRKDEDNFIPEFRPAFPTLAAHRQREHLALHVHFPPGKNCALKSLEKENSAGWTENPLIITNHCFMLPRQSMTFHNRLHVQLCTFTRGVVRCAPIPR